MRVLTNFSLVIGVAESLVDRFDPSWSSGHSARVD